MSQLVLQSLTKSFQGVSAVQDLWLTVKSGEIVALLGPSGCGKSTTLQLIAGILRPDAGQVELGDRALNRVRPEKRSVALILQKGLLFPHLSVGENVAFGLKMQGVSRVDRERQAIAMLQQVQLDGFAQRQPAELSGGQAQRVALARALVIQPQLLLLDEPLTALDANLREDMQDLILRLQADTGVTLVVVTHDQAEAVVMSHRIALMFDGRLRQVATPEQLYNSPCDQTTARFFGGVNFFAAQAHHHQLRIIPEDDGETIHVNNNSGMAECVLRCDRPLTGPVQVTIRPERIQVFNESQSQANMLPATVTASRFTGTQRRLTLTTNAGTLQAWVVPNQTFAVGQSVWAHLPANALWGFPTDAAPAIDKKQILSPAVI
ncbi:MAG: ABC transporter ATP-binding protein [Phormidesmis sp.]